MQATAQLCVKRKTCHQKDMLWLSSKLMQGQKKLLPKSCTFTLWKLPSAASSDLFVCSLINST